MQMAGQRVRMHGSFPGIPSLRGIAVLVLIVLFSVMSGGETSDGQEPVRVKSIRTPGHTSLIIENRAAYDATVTLTIHPENAQVTRIIPEIATCDAHQQIEAARISASDPNKPCQWRYDLRWAKGRMDARHNDDTRYRLPFKKGESYRVCQGYNGRWSHRGQDRYAADFATPEGTTVCAAREGVVVDLKESSKTGGPNRKYRDQSDHVSIAHPDGTIAEYDHLKYDGVLVKIGDRVTIGQSIGISGNTGYSALPHLHLGVYSAISGSRRQSHRLVFVTREGIVAEPIVGRTYTAE